MRLTDILSPRRVKIALAAANKEAVIEELVDLLAAEGAVNDRDQALRAALEREKTRTTGIGKGLAIPHAKTTAVGDLIMAIGTCPQGIDFQSIDDKPVTLVVLLLSPMDQTGPHIQALARISRLMNVDTVRDRLAASSSPEELLRIVRRQEEI